MIDSFLSLLRSYFELRLLKVHIFSLRIFFWRRNSFLLRSLCVIHLLLLRINSHLNHSLRIYHHRLWLHKRLLHHSLRINWLCLWHHSCRRRHHCLRIILHWLHLRYRLHRLTVILLRIIHGLSHHLRHVNFWILSIHLWNAHHGLNENLWLLLLWDMRLINQLRRFILIIK